MCGTLNQGGDKGECDYGNRISSLRLEHATYHCRDNPSLKQQLSSSDVLLKDVLGMAASGGSLSQSGQPANHQEADNVEVALFAPATCEAGATFLLQVFLQPLDSVEATRNVATSADPNAITRAIRSLLVPLERGASVQIDAEAAGCAIDEPRQTLNWLGQPTSAQFFVRVHRKLSTPIPVKVVISIDSVPVGTVRFMMTIAAVSHQQEVRGDDAQRFRKAFMSYASSDRVHVLKAAQLLRATGIDVFQDVLSLEPGERWEKRLYQEIDDTDLFLLFWSAAASKSKWVVAESTYALKCQEASQRPDIRPVLLEGPPIPEEPKELGSIHFNDRFRYFITAVESDVRRQ